MLDQTKPRDYRIASYNIRKARGLDGRRDPGRIIDVINETSADIVVLQEADRRLGNRPSALPTSLIAAATDFELAPLSKNDVSIGWHGNAVLVRRGIAISDASHIALPGAEPRGAVTVTLASGLTIVGVHLGLLRSSRRKQLQEVVRHVSGVGPSVVVGDMNEWSQSRGLEALHADYRVHSPGKSFHAARPIAALDRIAVSRGLNLKDAGVIENARSKRASDHLPIWAEISSQA
jgi:endonuclease/exonuclease/phosphatase family metal-dependent hydrolase